MADPTPADLTAAFPAFASVSTPTVQLYLTQAISRVNSIWFGGDIAFSEMLYACHLMVMQGLGNSPEARAIAAGAGIIKDQKAGGSEIEWNNPKVPLGTLGSTSYGRMLLEIRQDAIRDAGPQVSGVGDPCADRPYDGTIYPGWPGMWLL